MLADPEDLEPNLVGELDLFDQVAEPLCRTDRPTAGWIGCGLREGVDAELHSGIATPRFGA